MHAPTNVPAGQNLEGNVLKTSINSVGLSTKRHVTKQAINVLLLLVLLLFVLGHPVCFRLCLMFICMFKKSSLVL